MQLHHGDATAWSAETSHSQGDELYDVFKARDGAVPDEGVVAQTPEGPLEIGGVGTVHDEDAALAAVLGETLGRVYGVAAALPAKDAGEFCAGKPSVDAGDGNADALGGDKARGADDRAAKDGFEEL